ncbi:DUF4142 domain-containing protein [Azospirillum halopraeferens]|uniref:DUF4142 domain-containing protein n=1 Tax=Azospirillum halopraeferens TaxID=34010 RepID=UPI00041BEB73|nr:DUF4142 domain-containing protein [Azospirillum halopraeferens]
MRRLLAAACAVALIAGPVLARPGDASGGNLALQDRNFLREAAVLHMTGIRSGKMAQDRAADERVRTFGRALADTHARAIDDLQTLAADAGATLPDEVDRVTRGRLEALAEQDGDRFDRRFMDFQDEIHAAAIKLYEAKADGADDDRVRRYARTTLPDLHAHHDRVRATMTALTRSATGTPPPAPDASIR